MKILIINTVALKSNGITTVVYDLFKNMDKKDLTAEIAATLESDEAVMEGFNEIGVRVHNIPYRKNNLKKYCLELLKLIKNNKYDAVYVHGNSATMAIELFIAAIAGCKVRLVHSHSSSCEYKKIDNLLRPLFYRLYTKAFACGKLAGEWMFPNREYELIKNGRDIDKYRFNADVRERTRKKLRLDNDALAIGHVGNFNKGKNQKYLIHIFKEIKKKNKNAKLFLMGYGRTRKQIEELVRSLDLENDVVFMGSVDNVHEVLQAMDVMCLPSLYEGMPLVAVEWQIAALPCIISDTITRECAYTDLVEFVSLDEPYSVWADKILAADISKRGDIADDVIRETQENGFDIKRNAEELRELIINMSRN